MTLADKRQNIKNGWNEDRFVYYEDNVKAFIDKIHRLITIAHVEQWTEVRLQNEISKEAGKELTE